MITSLYRRKLNRFKQIESVLNKQKVGKPYITFTLADRSGSLSFNTTLRLEFDSKIERYETNNEVFYGVRVNDYASMDISDRKFNISPDITNALRFTPTTTIDSYIVYSFWEFLCNLYYTKLRDDSYELKKLKEFGFPSEYCDVATNKIYWEDINGKQLLDIYSKIEHPNFTDTPFYHDLKKIFEDFEGKKFKVSRNPRVYPKVKDMSFYPILRVYVDDNDTLCAKYFNYHPSIDMRNPKAKLLRPDSMTDISVDGAKFNFGNDTLTYKTPLAEWTVVDDAFENLCKANNLDIDRISGGVA